MATRKQPPDARGGAEPNAQPISRVSGASAVAQAGLTQIDFISGEGALRSELHPPKPPLGNTSPQDGRPEVGRISIDIDHVSGDPKLPDIRAALEAMDKDESPDFLNQLTSHLPPILGRMSRMATSRGFAMQIDPSTTLSKVLSSWVWHPVGNEASALDLTMSRLDDSSNLRLVGEVDHVYVGRPLLAGRLL